MRDSQLLDERFMTEAIKLAEKGIGLTSPNPYVGAVIVKNNKIIGRGYHKKAGLEHAEIDAIKNSWASLKGATMYVTLEPCAHYGKTPPCVDAIIKSGIKRVVIGEVDPNPLVNGKGVRCLKEAGVKVDIFQRTNEIRSLNCGFRKWILKKIPYVIVKVASSMDGRIADSSGSSKYISSNESRRFVHFVRFISDAILVGAGTIKKDDPLLDHRLYIAPFKKPITRIVLDGRLSLTPRYRVFRDDGARRIILTSVTAYNKRRACVNEFLNRGVDVLPLRSIKNRISTKDILEYLGSINILYLLVEGGRDVFTEFIDFEETDVFLHFIAPKLLGEGSIGFYKRHLCIEESNTDYVLSNIRQMNADVLLYYCRKGSDVYRFDRIYWEGKESTKKG